MKKTLLMIFILITISPAFAIPPEQGLYIFQGFTGLDFPIGAMADTALFCRFPLNAGDDMLFGNSHIDAGLENRITPSDELLALYFKIEPIAFFDMVFMGGYYGIFNITGVGFQPVKEKDSPYDPDNAAKLSHENRTGFRCMATPTFKVKFRNIILTHSITINYIDIFYSGYYIDINSDSILYGNDINIQNDTYGFYEINPRFLLGINHYYLSVPGTSYSSERLSAAAVIKPAVSLFYDFYTAILAGGYIKDHCYTGKLFFLLQSGFTVKL